MELSEQACPVCGGDGWSDWPYLPCWTCEGSGFDGPVVYLKPDDRADWFRNRPAIPSLTETIAPPPDPQPVAKSRTDWNGLLSGLMNLSRSNG